MKANRLYVLRDNQRAEVGVGTLIVFIAMVLVAAVAAAVLINTSGTLQERATATGKEATEEVSSNMKVVSVYGQRNDTSGTLAFLNMYTELSAGAPDLDLTQLIIRYSDGSQQINYAYGEWTPNWIRGTNTSAVMEAGDLVNLNITLPTSGLDNRISVEVLIIPEAGTPVIANFKTPATYGTDKTTTLR